MNDEEYMIFTLIDDEGNEHEFEVLDEIDTNDGYFYALLPAAATEEEALEADTYYIFQAIEVDGETQLAEVDDEELLDKLAEIFEARFDELYGEQQENLS